MKTKKKGFSFLRQYTSAVLIFLLFISQTIHVSFFDRTEAATTDYSDVVSIIVDEDTYNELQTKIEVYANDIQEYLKSTRVSIFVAPSNARPEVIAAHNEKLYYEGDGQPGISALVGTVLIGNVPIPVVHKDGLSFPSLYPYVDFDNKRFLYDTVTMRYNASKEANEGSDVDIWHGVINPSLGRVWDGVTDIPKIEAFLDKTHEFYTRSGKFAPATLPPRVFYYDGYAESLSTDPTTMYKYALFTENAENVEYKRWGKNLLRDITASLSQFQKANSGAEDAFASTMLGTGVTLGDEGLDASTLANLPDIQTATPIMTYLKRFHETINKKTLSDIQQFVHNAGRYNTGITVRVDQGAVQVSITDQMSMDVLKGANDALESSIDSILTTNNYARRIPILDGIWERSPILTGILGAIPASVALNPLVEYRNYYFGREARTITNPDQCTIARGWTGTTDVFKRPELVEANVMYDVNSTEGHVGYLSGDTDTMVKLWKNATYACFTAAGVPKLQSYWGGNSLLRVMGTSGDPATFFQSIPSGTATTGFSLPIFNTGGMKETTRLPNPSLADCMGNTFQYTLLQPHTFTYDIPDTWSYAGGTYSCTGGYPLEWTTTSGYCPNVALTATPRFTCNTVHTSYPGDGSINGALATYGTPCYYGTLVIDGQYFNNTPALSGVPVNLGGQCIIPGNAYAGTPDIDSTVYQNRVYHSIPSLLKHVSPTSDEVAAAEANGATPSLPVDVVRSVEFLTQKGGIARLSYPNFFEAPTTSIADVRAWLKTLSDAEWNAIITAEAARAQTPSDSNLALSLGAKPLPAAPIDWNTLITDDVIEKIIRAKRSLAPNVTQKYQNLLEASLSYSHTSSGDILDNPLPLPKLSEGYEIAYLGLTPFIPKGVAEEEDTSIQGYQYQLGELQGLNFVEQDPALSDPDPTVKAQSECGPPDGVPLFQWPSAIQCWIKTLFPIKIMPGSCGGNSIGLDKNSVATTSAPIAITSSSTDLSAYYAGTKIVYSVERTMIEPGGNLEITYYLDKDGALVELPPNARVDLSISNITAGGAPIPAGKYGDYAYLSSQSSQYTDQGSSFVLSSVGPIADISLIPRIIIPLPDGTNYESDGAEATFRVRDEFIDIIPTVATDPVSMVETTSTDPVILTFEAKQGTGITIPTNPPYRMDIYDDISGELVESGIVIGSDSFTLPDKYVDTIGVYRFIAADADGRVGESTLAVRSGPVSSMEFIPVSSAIVTGKESVGVLRLLDAKGNLISPSLLHLTATIANGTFTDGNGASVASMVMDTTEPEMLYRYTAGAVGNMSMNFSVTDPSVSTTANLNVINIPQVHITRSATPKVGEGPITIDIDLRDPVTNTPISGFSSIATLDIPPGAGSFNKTTVTITNGVAEQVIFTPGKVAGDHVFTIDIAGVGNTSEKKFNILPGVPMYVDGSISETNVEFTLRDRYGNLSPESPGADLKYNQDVPYGITFTDGKYIMPRVSGYWKVDVPSIKLNTITYDDNDTGNTSTTATGSVKKTITGISYYQLFVPDSGRKYSFQPDYNARYTVLAGDSYLSEASQILYDTTPGQSQSLAATTVLTTPYERESLFSIYPGGGFSVGTNSDTAIDTTLRNRGDNLQLDAYDTASQTPVARVAYPVRNLGFNACSETSPEVPKCSILGTDGTIMFVTYDGGDTTVESDATEAKMIVDTVAKVTYNKTNGLTLAPGVTLVPLSDKSLSSLVAEVQENGEILGKIIVHTDETAGVLIDDTNATVNDLTLDQNFSYSLSPSYSDVFSPLSQGYSLIRNPTSQVIDERLLGPSRIENFGALLDVPGVGWQGNNRTLLSYAAGDTVGEATRWFHTYTMVNLGDPVTHVDKADPSKGIAAPPETEVEGVDKSIGTQIASSSERYIQSYKRKDMNGDSLEDIIVVYNDGFLELYLNMGGTFRKKEKIAYLPYITSLGIELGDFTGDKYSDIIALDKSGSLALVDNNLRQLKEIPIKVNGGSIPSPITQYKVYDMDNDGRDDIVYLTEGGELGILYGTAAAGTFDKNILESTLGVKLGGDPETKGGAIRTSTTPTKLLASPSASGGQDESILNSEVFYSFQSNPGSAPISSSDVNVIDSSLSGTLTDPNLTPSYSGASSSGVLYVKSEYAGAYGLEIEKRYNNITSTTIHGGDRIQVQIQIKNTGAVPAKNVSYLDTLAKIFQLPEDGKYRVSIGASSQEKDFDVISGELYNLNFHGMDIPPGEILFITYELIALPTSYGTMIVDNLEKNLAGDDPFGDVGFETSNTCGADMMVWNSTAARTYLAGIRSFTPADLPPSLAAQLADANANGIPDSIEFTSGSTFTGGAQATLTNNYKSMTSSNNSKGTNIMSVNVNPGGQLATIGFSPNVQKKMETAMQNLADGLSCGFGGGGCLSSPINWAPLAPGNAISVLGNSVGRSPAVNQGIPIFSALTRVDIGVTPYCVTIPAIWPVSPLALDASLPCSSSNIATAWGEAVSQMPSAFMGVSTASTNIGAGGVLGTKSKNNFIRIFVTPTLTLGMGTAICLGPAEANGPNPLYPLVSKGNCIILTKSLPVCKGDGSAADGDVTGVSGLGTSTESWNSHSCQMKAESTLTPAQEASTIQDIINYLKSPDTTKLNSIYKNVSARGGKGGNLGGPLISMGDPATSGTSINIDIDSAKPLEIGKIVKVNNKRIAGFPEFIMDWVGRQTEELTNKLFTLPNLIIYTPKSFGPNTTGDLSELTSKFSEASIKKGMDELKAKVGRAGDVNVTNAFNKKTTGKTAASSSYDKWLDSAVSSNASTINSVAGGANQWKQAWKLIGQVPFVQVQQVAVPINIPWLLPQDLDRYDRSLKQYQKEWARAEASWCVGKTPAQCADIKTTTNTAGAQSTIKKTMKRIEEWRRFPEKLQKYITWKQRYVTQILCNIDVLERMVGGWYRDNGLRFKKWAEFYVLIKTIAETWQPFLDLWRDKDRSCSVCQNQRWDLKYWKFKMLSAVIPQIPILQFPRWPDIVLDLSDIRFGVLFRVPDFRFNISPIRLPDLPSIRLPNMPTASLTLGLNFDIPAPPNLPNLPDLPSLPKIKLPNLPTPPKLPKLFGAVSVGINIFKLYTKIQCYMEKTTLVPEDYAGATIAQRTDRQGTLPFDFLNVRLPQIAIGAWPREIRVSTHVNFQVKSDFLVEFAKAAVKPINKLNTDFARMPRKFAPDIYINGPGNKSLKLNGAIQNHDYQEIVDTLTMTLHENQSTELLDVDEFVPYLRSELLKAGLDVAKFDRSLTKARNEADSFTRDLTDKNRESFRLLREYLNAEQAEAKEQEKMIDRLKKGDNILSFKDAPYATFVSDTPSISESALNRFTQYQNNRLAQSDVANSNDLIDKMTSIGNRMNRLIAAASGPAAPSSGVASGYSPSFDGIYILTPDTKTQTRLFDYTTLLQGDEKADVVDIDGDGDKDYIYILGGSLYVKYNHKNDPVRPIYNTITTENIDPTLTPEVPNYFTENISSPGEIYISFRKADPLDTSFRLEFFNRYLEWDRVKLTGTDFADTPRTIIDLTIANDADTATVTPEYTEYPVSRSLESGVVGSGFVLEGMKVSTIYSGEPFGLSTGRPLYTGNAPAILSVVLEGTNEEKTYVLNQFTKYVFPDSLSGTITSGKAYVLTPSGTEKLSYTSDMLGMPLLPGTRVIDTNNTLSIYNPIENISTEIPVGTEYRHIGLTGKNDNYTVNFPFENGYYAARLRSLRTGNLIRAGITLLAPLAGLDRSAPVIELSDQKIPVYQNLSIPLIDAVSEASTFTLLADPDTTQDADLNGGYADDFVASSTGLLINSNSISFGQYDTLGSRFMNLSVVDAFGNKSTSPLKLDVYAPVPKIVSVSTGGVLSGSIDGEFANEPVHLFRVRQGEGITMVDPAPMLTNALGKFSLPNLFNGSTALSVTNGGLNVALSSTTGLPLLNPSISNEVTPATATEPLKIRFTDTTSSTPLFQSSVVPPNNIQVIGPTDTIVGTNPVLKVDPLGGADVVKATLSDPSIPGGMYIIASSVPVIGLDARGQIYLLDPTVKLRAVEEGGHLVIYASQGGIDIAKFAYQFDFFVAGK